VLLPARLLSDAGASVISNNGAKVLSNNGAGIIANNAGRIIANNAGRYVLAATEAQRPLTNAFLYLTDRDERFYLDADSRALTATLDASGRYAFQSGYPVGRDVIVNALANDNLRLVGFIIPTNAGGTLDLTLGTTLATEWLRGDALRAGRALSSYAYDRVRQVAADTQAAIVSQAIPAVRSATDALGGVLTVGVFDLRADHTTDLRNQYVISIAAVAADNAVIKAISDTWKAITGSRPAAVTSLIGNGREPVVDAVEFVRYGFATGDTRGGEATPPDQVPLGFNYGVAVGPAGDIFLSCYARQGSSGHIRWLKPNGEIKTLWLPTYALAAPTAVVLEKPPSTDVNNPGSVLVADTIGHAVFRIPLIDEPDPARDLLQAPCAVDGYLVERLSTQVVAGEATPLSDLPAANACLGYLTQSHPFAVRPASQAEYRQANYSSPLNSRWRPDDEGARRYEPGGAFIPQPARYAHLDGPTDVALDELGNIYIADKNNHRIRFIPSAQALAQRATWYDHREPVRSANQEIEALGSPTTMVAGAIYTIAGNPRWDPARTPTGATGWFGEFGGDGGPAQLARLDQPVALAFNASEKCLYVADFDNNRVRKIHRDTGVITTVAGSGTEVQDNGRGDIDLKPGYGGDGGPAAAARLARPRALAFDARQRLFIADGGNGLIRMVENDAARTISTVAGRPQVGANRGADQAGDGDARAYVDIYAMEKLAVDPAGNVLFNEMRHGRLRKLWRQWD
jgi:DNA-binding beta-propeller fold protein YncE